MTDYISNSKFQTQKLIIFRLYNSKDADRVVVGLTDNGERMSVLAKGVRKSTSRKAHAVDLLNFVEIKTAGGKQLPILSEIKLLNNAQQFKQTYQGLMFVHLVSEVLHLCVQEGADETAYFKNVENLLLHSDGKRLALVAAAFLLRVLYLYGALSKLNEDINSGLELRENQPRYTTSDAGYSATPLSESQTPVSSRLPKSQKFILQHSFVDIAKLKLEETEQIELLQLHLDWLQKALDKELKSASLFLATFDI